MFYAKQVDFLLSQVRNSVGSLAGGTITFYASGMTTPKTIWLDRSKASAAANPYTLDADGTAQLYAEGSYKIVIKNAAGATIYTRDNLYFNYDDNRYEIDALDVYGGGTSFTQATIQSALTAIGTVNKVTLLLRPGTWVISSNAGWSAYTNVTFKIVPGALISHGAFTVAFANAPEAEKYQIFSGSGAVTFTFARSAPVEWWGFASTASAAVNAAAWQAAINSNVPQVTLPNGSFDYSTGITIDRTIRIDGAGSCESNGQPGVSTTKLTYTGAGIGLSLVGSTENIHLYNFSLFGTASATGGILIGSFSTVMKSSLTNIHVSSFSKVGAYGIKLMSSIEMHYTEVYAQFNYDGWVIGAIDTFNTSSSFMNCWSRQNIRYGWYISKLVGSSLYQCMAESNGNNGLCLYSNGVWGVDFYSWYSEANNITGGTAPIVITGPATAPFSINFYGGVFTDGVGNLIWDIDYASLITWNNLRQYYYGAGFMSVTANTAACSFVAWRNDISASLITNNAPGRVNVVNDLSSKNPTNILHNADFETWSAGAAAVPDGWTKSEPGSTIAREGATKLLGAYSAALTRVGTDCYLYQTVHSDRGINYWKGKTMTFGVWVWSNSATVLIYIAAGGSTVLYHPGDSAWHYLIVSRTIPDAAVSIFVAVHIADTNTTIYIDGAMVIEGWSSQAFSRRPALVDTSLPASTGAGTVKMGSANAANSAGWLKVQNSAGTWVYVPYWSTDVP